jgi:hypothetical protein
MRPTRKTLWVVLGASVLALLGSVGTTLYGGWGPCGPAKIEGMLLMTVGILGVLGSGLLITGDALLGFARHVWRRIGST